MTSGSESGGQDFDLNLAPIIDCFTVLITFMLVHAIDAKNVAPICDYMERLPPEFITTFVTAVGKRGLRTLLVNPVFVKKLTARNSALINAIASL